MVLILAFCSAGFHKELHTKANSTLELPSWFKREGAAGLSFFRGVEQESRLSCSVFKKNHLLEFAKTGAM